METKGKLRNVSYENTNIIAEIEISNDHAEELINLFCKDIRIEMKEWKEKRSKNANSYFHLLSDKLADKLRMSKPKMKNYLLYHYGQKVRDENNSLVIVKTNADEEKLISRSDIHLWYLKDSVDGTPMYVLLEHSRFYDTNQMAILIDGVVNECKSQGIPTDTPDEIAKMKALWGKE